MSRTASIWFNAIVGTALVALLVALVVRDWRSGLLTVAVVVALIVLRREPRRA